MPKQQLRVESPSSDTVTFLLKGVPWDQAFDVLARCNGLHWAEEGSTIRLWR
jgi:hypothetical protein